MAKRGLIVIRAGNAEHAMALSSRDVYLLDGQYFFKNGWQYRKLLGLNFFRGLKSPPLGVPLVTFSISFHPHFHSHIRTFDHNVG